VLPELARNAVAVTLLGRKVADPSAFGVVAEQIAWGSDESPPVPAAASEVARVLEALRPDVVLLSNVFDIAVLRAVRAARRVIARIHDHRMFCPTGDRVYPQFDAICTTPMGGACGVSTLIRGCVRGPRRASCGRSRQ